MSSYTFTKATTYPNEVTTRLASFKKTLHKPNSNKNEVLEAFNTHILPSGISVGDGTKYGKLDSKTTSKLIGDIQKDTGKNFEQWYYLILNAGFLISTVFNSSYSPDNLELPDKFKKQRADLINDINNEKITPVEFESRRALLNEEVVEYFNNDKNNSLMDYIKSGTKGKPSDIGSLLVSVGLSIDSTGSINDIVTNSLSEGLSQTQFFNNSSQGIQSLYSKSSETATPGYLGRKLSTMTEPINLGGVDCGTKDYLDLYISNTKMANSLLGRTALVKNKEVVITNKELVSIIKDKRVKIRSSTYCSDKNGICVKCYNESYVSKMKLKEGSNIGLLASTSMTNVLVSLTLKKSHTGIGLDAAEVDYLNDLIIT